MLTNLFGLYLRNNKLSGEIPTELRSLTKLQVLLLSGNDLSGEIPSELGRLNLYFLYLHNNNLSGPIPTQLESMTNLYRLYLHNNQLSGSIPDTELGRLPQLQELALWGNEELMWNTISNELGKKVDRAALRSLYDVNGGED